MATKPFGWISPGNNDSKLNIKLRNPHFGSIAHSGYNATPEINQNLFGIGIPIHKQNPFV
jgi:hypothetical protein